MKTKGENHMTHIIRLQINYRTVEASSSSNSLDFW